MRVKVGKRKLNIVCESAGISAFPGDTVTENAVKAALVFGADISSHRARRLSEYMLNGYDLFVCMTQSHKNALLPFLPEEKLYVLGNVPDPYGGDEEVYLQCAEKISSEIDKFLEQFCETEIHPMTEDAVKAVSAIEKECFSIPWSEDGIREELTNENARFFVAEKNGEIVGYMGMHIVLDECYIANVAVLPSCRRQGIGERLVSNGIDIAEKEGCAFITLEVRVSNSAAVTLYEKKGFEKMGERKNFYSDPTENALIMTKFFK